MLKIKKILVPVDFSSISLASLNYAAHIADKVGAEIILLHVMESYQFNSSLKDIIDPTEMVKEAVTKKLNKIREENTKLWMVKITPKVVSGKIYKQISATINKEKIDLVVMGTHGATGITNVNKYFLGSNAYRAVYESNIPTITIRRENQKFKMQTICLPLDITKETKKKVEMAIDWAKMFDAKIHVISVSTFLEEFVVSIGKLELQLRNVLNQIKEAGVACDGKMLRHDDVVDQIMKYVKKEKSDMMVIMTGRETLLNRFTMSSNAREVIEHSEIPVMSIRPDKK